MSFFEFPYTRTYSSDLGWLIRHVKWLTDQVENKTIKYADPIGWNITSQYEMNTVVLDGTVAYLSKQAVPSGVSIANTDYWMPIFDIAPIVGDIGNLRDQISAHYEETYTATRNYNAGDWMFINDGSDDLLYYALTAISVNGGLVPDVTVKKATIEEIFLLLAADLATLIANVGDLADLTTSDKSSVVNAINELDADIGDLANLTTSDKSSAVNAINEVDADLGTLETNVGDLANLNTIDKSSVVNAINETLATAGKIVYNPSDAYSLDDTGATDCSAILAGISDNVGFKAGTYLIAADCTISANMLFPEGAKLSIDAGVTVTINGYIAAGLYEIFTGAGSVLIRGNSEIYPEWFGAAHDLVTDDADAIQAAFDSINAGAVILQAGKYNYYQDSVPTSGYYTSKKILVDYTQSDVSIKCAAGKAVIYSDAAVCIELKGSTDNGATGFISNAFIENLIIFYKGTVPTPSSYNETVGIKIHGGIRNRITDVEVYEYLTDIFSEVVISQYIDRCVLHAANKLYGCCIYLNDTKVNNAVYPNASFHVNNSILFGGSNSTGITAIGDILSDLFVRNNEFGGMYEAVSMNLDNPYTSAFDIHITDNIMDNVTVGIDINTNDIAATTVNIRGNWIAARGSQAIKLNNAHNATVIGNSIAGNLSSGITGVAIISSNSANVSGNTFVNTHSAIGLNQAQFCTISGNTVLISNMAANDIISAVTVGYTNISGNTLRTPTGASATHFVALTGTGNVVNWNMKTSAVTNSIATGNIVDGASI